MDLSLSMNHWERRRPRPRSLGIRSTPARTPALPAPVQMQKLRPGLGVARWLCIVVCTLLLARVASAQSYSIDWYKVSGGGGTSTGGTYQVSGTIGQHDAVGPMTGGSFSVTGGFWALIAPVQTPGAPTLYISQGTNSVTVYWQAVPSWSLQQNPSVTAPAGWSTSTGVTTGAGTNYLTLIRPTGQLFFRLVAP